MIELLVKTLPFSVIQIPELAETKIEGVVATPNGMGGLNPVRTRTFRVLDRHFYGGVVLMRLDITSADFDADKGICIACLDSSIDIHSNNEKESCAVGAYRFNTTVLIPVSTGALVPPPLPGTAPFTIYRNSNHCDRQQNLENFHSTARPIKTSCGEQSTKLSSYNKTTLCQEFVSL